MSWVEDNYGWYGVGLEDVVMVLRRAGLPLGDAPLIRAMFPDAGWGDDTLTYKIEGVTTIATPKRTIVAKNMTTIVTFKLRGDGNMEVSVRRFYGGAE